MFLRKKRGRAAKWLQQEARTSDGSVFTRTYGSVQINVFYRDKRRDRFWFSLTRLNNDRPGTKSFSVKRDTKDILRCIAIAEQWVNDGAPLDR